VFDPAERMRARSAGLLFQAMIFWVLPRYRGLCDANFPARSFCRKPCTGMTNAIARQRFRSPAAIVMLA
jgi:hypothetical protein